MLVTLAQLQLSVAPYRLQQARATRSHPPYIRFVRVLHLDPHVHCGLLMGHIHLIDFSWLLLMQKMVLETLGKSCPQWRLLELITSRTNAPCHLVQDSMCSPKFAVSMNTGVVYDSPMSLVGFGKFWYTSSHTIDNMNLFKCSVGIFLEIILSHVSLF
jgi:hypothetical protein